MFDYLIEKIQQAQFQFEPFRYIYIQDWLSDQHFAEITADPQINLAPQTDLDHLLQTLEHSHYSPEPFPGCTTNIDHYRTWFHSNRTERFESDLLEGFGIAFRLRQYDSPLIQSLIEFLNSNAFHAAIKAKFERTGNTRVETAIQKYLSGYEISPHPDIRKKCLTYMVNINTEPASEAADIHTHLLEFDADHQHIYQYWQDHADHDRCWVPWSWCESQWQHRANNSIVMFAPDDRSLHAVKLEYDHLPWQRTQIYGNLWYRKGSVPAITVRGDWRRLPDA
jgi:hypothetical protein